MIPSNNLNILRKPSILLLLFTLCFSIWFSDLWKPWHRLSLYDTPFVWDVAQYYSYLPATFIYDGDFGYNKDFSGFCCDAPLGGKMPKTTYGMSILYAPFFALAYKISVNTHSVLDGYSGHFSTWIHFGSVFYGLLGLLLLRNLLIKFFSEKVTAITLAIVFFGTTVFAYVLSFSEMTHGYLLMLISAFLLTTYHWYNKITFGRTILLGLLIGIISLIRPTEILMGLFFLFWMVNSKQDLKDRFKLLAKNYIHLFLMAVILVLIWIPQFIFWKYKTGHYLYFSYPGEGFFWSDPQIINILFSYRKGWLMYSPLVVLAFVGFFFMKGEVKKLRNLIVFITLATIYILSCWWDWSFGGSFAGRSFTQSLAFLAFPLAALVSFVMEWMKESKLKPIIQILFFSIVFSGICLNIGQTYQYNNGMIHFSSMSKKAYWIVFNKYRLNEDENRKYWKSLIAPDYDEMLKGKRDK